MRLDQEYGADGKQGARKTILIVEDDTAIAAFLALVISQETSYYPYTVQNTTEAMAVIKHIKPHLFMFDYHLPCMNGIELYEQLHALDELAAIPAIIMSASMEQHQAEIEQRHLVGIAKPLELDDFLMCIEHLLATETK